MGRRTETQYPEEPNSSCFDLQQGGILLRGQNADSLALGHSDKIAVSKGWAIQEGNPFTNTRASVKQAGNYWSPLPGWRHQQQPLFEDPQDYQQPMPPPATAFLSGWTQAQCSPGTAPSPACSISSHPEEPHYPKTTPSQGSFQLQPACQSHQHKESTQGTLPYKANYSRPGEVAVLPNSQK